MKCPVDDATLVMSDRQGIEIDYCPTCRGVWLDRGEIDKIIERSLQQGQGGSQPRTEQQYDRPPQYQERRDHRDYDDDDDYRSNHGHGHHKKHKESWFGELFD